jgi:hypothetical protein
MSEEYGLLMAARCHGNARGGEHRATIREGFIFFSGDYLSDAEPIPVKDRLEWILGVVLMHADAQYIHIQARPQELTLPIKRGKDKCTGIADVLKEKCDNMVKAGMCADRWNQR